MPKRSDIKKIMVIGSGPIIIGQAAEFDYAGTQACLALKEEGYSVVLVNSNPATIMTDKEIADKVYIEPITLEFVTRILRKERPDALLPTLGGQTGLNMAMELSKAGILDELGVELLGTKLSAIDQAEDRDLFKQLIERSIAVSRKSNTKLCVMPQTMLLWYVTWKTLTQLVSTQGTQLYLPQRKPCQILKTKCFVMPA